MQKVTFTRAILSLMVMLSASIEGFSQWTNGAQSSIYYNTGNVGIGTATPHAPLHFAMVSGDRKIVLWESANNATEFYGFGVNANVLRYQTDKALSDHVFYSAINATSSKELMRIRGNGNVGIDVAIPTDKFHVNGAGRFASGLKVDNQNFLEFGFGVAKEAAAGRIGYETYTAGALDIVGAGTTVANRKIKLFAEGGLVTAGAVGVNMPVNRIEPGSALSVNGPTYIGNFGTSYNAGFVRDTLYDDFYLYVERGIVTEDIALAKVTDWDDYVFNEDYSLPGLKNVASFVQTNKHLPNIPSEAEIKRNGYTQHKMNRNFLKTMEEMTLYAIEQDKKIDALGEKVSGLEAKFQQYEKLSEEMTKLKAMLVELKK